MDAAALAAPLIRLLPEALARVPGSAAADITLEQILTGRTGLAYNWVVDDLSMRSADDPVRFALSLQLEAAKPLAWNYNDAAVGLIGPVLARAEGLDVAALAARDLFAPLAIRQSPWRRDRSGQPTASAPAAPPAGAWPTSPTWAMAACGSPALCTARQWGGAWATAGR